MKYELFVLQMKMLKELKESKEDLEREIEDIYYQYGGVHGVRYDKQLSTSNPYSSDERLLMLSEKLVEPQKELEKIVFAINQLEPQIMSDLNKLDEDIRNVCELIYFQNKTYDEVGRLVGYSTNGLWYRVKKEIQKI